MPRATHPRPDSLRLPAIEVDPRGQQARAKQHHERQDQYRRVEHRKHPSGGGSSKRSPHTSPIGRSTRNQLAPQKSPTPLAKMKRPPGNRVASSLGRIVPTEAKPSELSGEILSLAKTGVKD